MRERENKREVGSCYHVALKKEDGVGAKECRQPLETRKEKASESLPKSPEGA